MTSMPRGRPRGARRRDRNCRTLSANVTIGGARSLFGSAHRPQLATISAAAEEPIGSIGLEPRNGESGRHRDRLEHLSCLRIDSPEITLLAFPCAVPELAVDPGHSSDMAVALDRAQDFSGLRIDLMDLPLPVLPDPERSFGPGQSRVSATTRRRNRGEDTAGFWIDLVDLLFGDLVQVFAVEGCPCVCGDIDRAQCLAARGIEGPQRIAGSKPDLLAVKRNPAHIVDALEGSILTNDLGI